jgi:hypothetical protein
MERLSAAFFALNEKSHAPSRTNSECFTLLLSEFCPVAGSTGAAVKTYSLCFTKFHGLPTRSASYH